MGASIEGNDEGRRTQSKIARFEGAHERMERQNMTLNFVVYE
jgi:hypothetical protein